MKKASKLTLYLLFVLAAASSPAFAMKYFLSAQWYENGSHMCKYGNGTVLNVGYRICPLSIDG